MSRVLGRESARQDPLGLMGLGPAVLLKQLKTEECVMYPPAPPPRAWGISSPTRNAEPAGTRWEAAASSPGPTEAVVLLSSCSYSGRGTSQTRRI